MAFSFLTLSKILIHVYDLRLTGRAHDHKLRCLYMIKLIYSLETTGYWAQFQAKKRYDLKDGRRILYMMSGEISSWRKLLKTGKGSSDLRSAEEKQAAEVR